MMLSHEQVRKFLPHREPFLFVDTVSEIKLAENCDSGPEMRNIVGSEVIAHYKTRADHPIFSGHFPGNPILPGVVQVEMIAQVSSFGLAKIRPDSFETNIDMALLSVNSAKFRKPVVPEMDLTIKTKCLKLRGHFMTTEGELYVGDELYAQASIMASIKIT